MSTSPMKIALIALAASFAFAGVARADCESDLLQLEAAYKAPKLTDAQKGALDAAKPLAVAALKKDDDKTCHTAVADGLAKAGVTMTN